MTESLRICMLSDGFYPQTGGAELQALSLSKSLLKRGYKVIAITRHIDPSLPQHETVEGVTVYRIPPSGSRTHLINIMQLVTFTYALLRHRNQFDVLHVHDMYSLIIVAVIFRIITGTPVIAKVPTKGDILRKPSPSIRLSFYSRLLRQILLPRFVWFWLLRRVSAFIAISRDIKEELEFAELDHMTHMIPNGVDTTRFKPVTSNVKQQHRQALGLPEDAYIVISHGRIVQRKRLDVVIRAVAQVQKLYPQVYLVLPGEVYPLNRRPEVDLIRLAEQAGIPSRVQFPGRTPVPEQYLQAADAFVLASEREGMPNALLEAMSCGLPVIASDISGVRDIVNRAQVAVETFDVGDVDELADTLVRLIDNPGKAQVMGEANCRHVEAHFSIEAVVIRYDQLYDQLILEE